MNFLNKIANGFIMAFGITQPTPSQQKTATLFIAVLLAGVVGFLIVMGLVLLHDFHG